MARHIYSAYGYTWETTLFLVDELLTLAEINGMRPPVSGDLESQMRAAHLNKWEKETEDNG